MSIVIYTPGMGLLGVEIHRAEARVVQSFSSEWLGIRIHIWKALPAKL